MLVVFVGNRASGKTSIAKALYQEYDKRSIRYRQGRSTFVNSVNLLRKVGDLAYLWRFFNLKIFKVYFGSIRRKPLRLLKSLSIYRLYFPLILSHNLNQLAQRLTDVVVYDNDLVSWSGDNGLRAELTVERVRELYSQTILPKAGTVLVVVVDTPISESMRRWSKREQKNMSVMEREAWLTDRDDWEQSGQRVVRAVSNLPQIMVMTLDGTLNPKENARLVAEKTATCLRGHM